MANGGPLPHYRTVILEFVKPYYTTKSEKADWDGVRTSEELNSRLSWLREVNQSGISKVAIKNRATKQ